MRAARDFAIRLREEGLLHRVQRITCTLYGSLGATGIGHGTPDAVVAGLQGLSPETVDPAVVRSAWTSSPGGSLLLDGTHPIAFEKSDVIFAARVRLPGHPNAMTIEAWSTSGSTPDAEASRLAAAGSSAVRGSLRG